MSALLPFGLYFSEIESSSYRTDFCGFLVLVESSWVRFIGSVLLVVSGLRVLSWLPVELVSVLYVLDADETFPESSLVTCFSTLASVVEESLCLMFWSSCSLVSWPSSVLIPELFVDISSSLDSVVSGISPVWVSDSSSVLSYFFVLIEVSAGTS